MNRRRLTTPEWAPRLLAAVAVAGGLMVLWRRDAVAAGLAVVAGAVLARLVVRRGPGALRRSGLLLGAGAGVLAVGSAAILAVPVRAIPPRGPLLVTAPDPAAGPATAGTPATVLGFVAPDYGDAGAVIDRDGPLVSTVAATGITLAAQPGGIAVPPAGDVPARAHLRGASALAVVSNYDGTQFNGDRAAAALASASARRRLVTALVKELDRRQWDGVVLDFERLPESTRAAYPGFVAELARAAGDRPVLVAVPAQETEQPDGPAPYDLAALGKAADQVMWMAYDQHTAAGEAGPVAGLPWVRRTL
ncbi:MAG TPA: glycosyl hydrolase family 18 protein, partial [Acidimicrobiia bacterium]|nr:glycosyl hydrolase family 18 protein [Acidimicrobiia bacterium]